MLAVAAAVAVAVLHLTGRGEGDPPAPEQTSPDLPATRTPAEVSEDEPVRRGKRGVVPPAARSGSAGHAPVAEVDRPAADSPFQRVSTSETPAPRETEATPPADDPAPASEPSRSPEPSGSPSPDDEESPGLLPDLP